MGDSCAQKVSNNEFEPESFSFNAFVSFPLLHCPYLNLFVWSQKLKCLRPVVVRTYLKQFALVYLRTILWIIGLLSTFHRWEGHKLNQTLSQSSFIPCVYVEAKNTKSICVSERKKIWVPSLNWDHGISFVVFRCIRQTYFHKAGHLMCIRCSSGPQTFLIPWVSSISEYYKHYKYF